jgi:hypothetical protein
LKVDSLFEKSAIYLQKFRKMDFENYDLFKMFIQNMLLLALYKESSTYLVKKASKGSNEEEDENNPCSNDGEYQKLLQTLSDWIVGNQLKKSNNSLRKVLLEMILSSLTDYHRFIPFNNSSFSSLVENMTTVYQKEFLLNSNNDEVTDESLTENISKENGFSLKYRVSNKNNAIVSTILSLST